jgi:predicted transcriptional regulator
VLFELAAEIVSVYVGSNAVPTDQLPRLIQQVLTSLATVEQKTVTPPRPDPAVPIKQSVRPDHVVCLNYGNHFSMLRRRLMIDHHVTPEQHRQRWGLRVS